MAVDPEATARALVKDALNGDLKAVTHAEQPHQLRFARPILPLRDAPVTAVSEVKIDGETVDATSYTFTPFALIREDGRDWPTSRILVTYTTGWTEGGEPPEVQQAIEAVTERLTNRPDSNVTSEAADDIRVTYGEATAFTSSERSLIRSWIRP